jgi:hypothetical protein
MLEADDVRHDGIVQRFIVAYVDGDRDPLILVVDLDQDLWRLQVLDLFLHQLLRGLFYQLRNDIF